MQLITVLESLLEKEKKSSTQLEKAIQREVKSCLIRAQVISKADRVLLFQLHNGEFYKSKQARYRLSVTEEEPSRGFERIEPELQDLPIARFKKQIDLLGYYKVISVDSENQLIYKGKDSEPLPEHWRLFMAHYGVAFSYEVSLFSKGEIIGILSFHYSGNRTEQIKQFDINYSSIMNVIDILESTFLTQ